jgi:hypothetical protein
MYEVDKRDQGQNGERSNTGSRDDRQLAYGQLFKHCRHPPFSA